ncbi:MAG: molybdenum cofactor biosynthesis protein MoaE [Devosia sp.]|uniref:molybdenum cofactor biosynthesis protein MoaE n=1 Tax=Devosia sp. TaxID=1871048 RepID=UPI001AC01330|nr:molybdenum cofactor biosynthesis protein MoaE [Devosia sp.]MBN9316385.1 molybdenum cofactor biosynthesis protein MoaE [Devosia sp.]
MSVRLQAAPFDPGAETNAFLAASAGAGAAVTFTGLVRSRPDDPVSTLTLEAYPELAEAQIGRAIAEAVARFGLIKAAVIHRYGALDSGEPIVQVMTLAPHRQAAFDGASFLMDYLKTDAPFWKKEATPAGNRWVEAKAEDDHARDKWNRK